MTKGWTERDVPDQTGRTFAITGANSGIGFETARVLAERGATVVMACRNATKAVAAAETIRRLAPASTVTVVDLDLANLASIADAAAEIRELAPQLDGLINNAGVLALEERELTADGFEMQFGTNHLGHFALTGQILPSLLTTEDSRVVTVSSNAHKMGTINWADIHSATRYRRWKAYGQSKLANAMFAIELHRRLDRADTSTISVAAHPGYAATHLTDAGLKTRLQRGAASLGARLMAQSAADGAVPTLRAACDPAAKGGSYYGPAGRAEYTGPAVLTSWATRARDVHDQRALWELSVEATGVDYAALDALT